MVEGNTPSGLPGASMFQGLRRIFGRPRVASKQPPPASQPPISREELLQHLEAIQSQAASVSLGSEECLGFSLANRLKARLGPQRPLEQLAGDERQALLYADLLFRFLRQDIVLPTQLRPMLALLHAPYLRLMLLDPEFMRADQHPGWSLLNEIGRALVGWSPEFENSGNSLRRRVELAVGRMLTDFDGQIDLLEQISDEFARVSRSELQLARLTEDRTLRTLRGNDVLEGVQRRVRREVSGRIENNSGMPKVLELILQDVWKNVLLKIGLSKGLQSEDWRRAVRFMDSLLWTLSPDAGKQHREKVVQMLPLLNNQLRRGFAEINYDPEKRRRLTAGLQELHLACLRGSNVWGGGGDVTTTVILGSSLRGERRRSGVQEQPSTEDAQDDFLWIANSLPEGSWLDLRDGERTRQRIKLAWRDSDGQSCLFVDRHGKRCAEIGCEQLADMLRKSHALVLSDTDQSFRIRFHRYLRSMANDTAILP